MKAIATYPISNYGGLEILDIIFGINDYVYYCFNFGYPDYEKIHKARLYTNSKGTYFKANDMRIYLEDCIKY